MWRLLKSEVSYHGIIQLSLIMVFFHFMLNSMFGQYISFSILMVIFISILMISIIRVRNENRIDRQNTLLPLSIKNIGLGRSLLILAPLIILIPGLFITSYLLLPSTTESVLILIGQIGFVTAVIGAFLLIHDVFQINNSYTKSKTIIVTLIATLFVLVSQVIVFFLVDLYDPKFSQGKGIIIIYSWGIVLTFLSTISFIKRKSYLR